MRRLTISFAIAALVGAVSASPALGVVSISPGSADFGTLPVGSQSTPKTFTLSNQAPGSSYTAVPGVGVDTGFKLVGNTCPSLLAVGDSCTLEVAFAPTKTGPFNGGLTGNQFTGDPYAELSGNGSAPGSNSGKGKKCKKKKGRGKAAAAKKKGCKKKKKKK